VSRSYFSAEKASQQSPATRVARCPIPPSQERTVVAADHRAALADYRAKLAELKEYL